MKRILQFPLLLLALVLALGNAHTAWATHAQAGELTYFSLGNNQYRVRVTFFRDCGGGPASPINFALTCRSGGCSGGTTVTATLLPPSGFPAPGTFTTPSPYCPTATNVFPCTPNSSNPNARTNTVAVNYEGVVTLPPSAEWVLSIEEGARPSISNISNSSSGTLRLEATLNNRITPVGGGPAVNIANNSPQFNQQSLPVPFVCWRQSSILSFSATDVDRLATNGAGALTNRGDSLVYSLDRPLSGCGVFETYATYPGSTCAPGIDPRCISRIVRCNGITATYSATLPIAVTNDTIAGPCTPGVTTFSDIRPKFVFNRSSGSFRFTPVLYTAGANSPDNKYAVVGKVTEYRKINGRYYKIGSVRRDFLVVVIDCGDNIVPEPPTGSATDPLSGAVITSTLDTLELRIKTCNYTRVRIPFTDPNNVVSPTNPVNLRQRLTVFAPADINTNILQGGDIGSFGVSYADPTAPVGTFFFQPSSLTAGTRLNVTLRIEDDACPAKGIQYRSIVIIIEGGSSAKALATAAGLGSAVPVSICPGGFVTLRGAVQRPDSIRRTSPPIATVLQTYGFQWTAPGAAPGSSGLPAVTNTATVRVSPLVSTRYLLRTYPLQGFGASLTNGICGDTATILVRVVPEPVARIALADTLTRRVCGGAAVQLLGSVSRADGLADTYTYRWSGPGVPPNTTSQNVGVAAPLTPGFYTYQLVATGAAQFGCDATVTRVIEVVAPPTIVARNYTPSGVCAGAAVSLRARATRSDNLADTYSFRWDAAPGLDPADANRDSLVVRPTQTTRYRFRVTGLSRFNCTDTASVLVRVVAPPVVTATRDVQYVCAGGTARLAVSTVAPTGLADTYTYTWSGPGLTAGASGATLAVQPTTPGINTYTVTATGTTRFGCVATSTVQVEVLPVVAADFATADSVGLSGQRTSRPPVIFTVRSTTSAAGLPAAATLSYQWTYQRVRDIAGAPATPFDNPVVFGGNAPTATTPALALSGSYLIKLTTTVTVNGASCTASVKTRTVVVPDVQVPNVITPNNDGLNDVFKVSTANTSSKLEIYNRWGRKVYEQTNYRNNWGGGNEPAGVYYYLLTDSNGATTKGWLEVLR